MKRIIVYLVLICFALPAFCEDYIDFSYDGKVRNQYNVKAIELEALPPLPETYTQYPTKKTPSESSKQFTSYVSTTGNPVKIPVGQKFDVYLNGDVSSSTPKGTVVIFENAVGKHCKGVFIPAKTKFKGIVLDSHPPQIGGNGGLIVLMVNEIVYRGHSYPIEGQILRVNGKKIFFGNIKGGRGYLKKVAKSMQPGSHFMSRMFRVSCRLAQDSPEFLITPFPILTGAVVYCGNAVAAPVLGIFSKGETVRIPAFSRFTIKLKEDALLY